MSLACRTTKFVALVPVPPGVVIAIGPVLAPAGTVAVICVSESTVKLDERVPWKATAVAPVKPVPVMTTEVPTVPLAGVNKVIVGAGVTVKFVELVPVPFGVVTAILPVTAPEGTVAAICVAEFTVKLVEETPPKVTDVAPVKLVPVITTDVPGPPLGGVNEVIDGPFVVMSRLQPPEIEPNAPASSSYT